LSLVVPQLLMSVHVLVLIPLEEHSVHSLHTQDGVQLVPPPPIEVVGAITVYEASWAVVLPAESVAVQVATLDPEDVVSIPVTLVVTDPP